MKKMASTLDAYLAGESSTSLVTYSNSVTDNAKEPETIAASQKDQLSPASDKPIKFVLNAAKDQRAKC